MERIVPYRVLRTVRRVAVTSQRGSVWVVSLDTKVLSVIQVSTKVVADRNILENIQILGHLIKK